MKTVIRVSPRDSAKAWALLVRHSPGVALPDRIFVVSEEAVRALRKAGIRFAELSREASMSGAAAGERKGRGDAVNPSGMAPGPR